MPKRKARSDDAEVRRRCDQLGRKYPSAAQCRAQGKVLRSGSITKNDVVRCPTCIKDVGKPGKAGPSTPRIPITKGTLDPWKATEPAAVRRDALVQAVEREMRKTGESEHDAAVSIARHMNVLYIFRKNDRRPAVALTCNRVLDDEEWLRNYYDLEPLDRKARQCPLSEQQAIGAMLATEASTQRSAKKKSKAMRVFQPANSWREFLKQNAGQGFSMKELGEAWQRLK